MKAQFDSTRLQSQWSTDAMIKQGRCVLANREHLASEGIGVICVSSIKVRT